MSQQNMETPDYGFYRLDDVLRIIPVSRSTWWANVKKGIYPQPYKISERATAWKVADIRKLAEEIGRNKQNPTPLTTVNEDGFLRLNEVLRIIPVNQSTWWANVKKGTYPQPYKISERRTAWKVGDIRKLAEEIGRDEQSPS